MRKTTKAMRLPIGWTNYCPKPSRGRKRNWRYARIHPVAHQDVGESDAGGQNFQAHLAGPRLGKIFFDELEYFWTASSGNDCAFVFHRLRIGCRENVHGCEAFIPRLQLARGDVSTDADVLMTRKTNFLAEFKRQSDGSWKIVW